MHMRQGVLASLQEVFLSGRDNRVDKQRKEDFKGTLRERRERYQDRRDAQGQETSRLLKRMRAEEGLDKSASPDAVQSPVCATVCTCVNQGTLQF